MILLRSDVVQVAALDETHYRPRMSLTHPSFSVVFWRGADVLMRLGTPGRRGGSVGPLFWVRAALLGLFGVFLAAPVGATPTLEQEQEIRTTFVTPHTAWAKPYAGGTTRVLFFSDYKNTQAREIVELMQRFEVQADAAYYTRVKVAKKPQM